MTFVERQNLKNRGGFIVVKFLKSTALSNEPAKFGNFAQGA